MAMTFYSDRLKRAPSFRIRYRKLDSPVRLGQHLRCDVKFADDQDIGWVWSIWPEFEDEPGLPIDEGTVAADVGTATMWVILDGADDRRELAERLRPGAVGWLVGGSLRIAEFTIDEVFDTP
jgi:hypothetical protein